MHYQYNYSTNYGPVYVSHSRVVRCLGFTTGSQYADYALFAQRFAWWRAGCLGKATRRGVQR